MELRRNLADDQKAVSTNTQPTRQTTHRRRLWVVPGRLELAIVPTLVRICWAPKEAASKGASGYGLCPDLSRGPLSTEPIVSEVNWEQGRPICSAWALPPGLPRPVGRPPAKEEDGWVQQGRTSGAEQPVTAPPRPQTGLGPRAPRRGDRGSALAGRGRH